MTQALWIAKTGLDAQQTRMAVISNNLANTNTTGFKRDRASFEDLLYQTQRQPGAASSEQTQLPTGMQTGTGVRIAATAKEFSQGNLNQTGNALDVAINGRGFFEVLMPDGSTAYTRDGRFRSIRRARSSPTKAIRYSPACNCRKARRASPSVPTAPSACR